jgi:hypothetical protein
MWEFIELFKKNSYSSEIKSNKPSLLKTPQEIQKDTACGKLNFLA